VRPQGYAICKLISFRLETMRDTPNPSIVMLLVGPYRRPPSICCAAEESASEVCGGYVWESVDESGSGVVRSDVVGWVA
jgi:hypothetical protein